MLFDNLLMQMNENEMAVLIYLSRCLYLLPLMRMWRWSGAVSEDGADSSLMLSRLWIIF